MFDEVDAACFDTVIHADVVEQVIELPCVVANEASEFLWILLPLQKEEQLIHINAGEVDRVARSLISETDRVTVSQFGSIQLFDGGFP